MFGAIWSAIVGGTPGSWAVLALGTLVSLGAAAGSGAYVVHQMDEATVTSMKLADAKARIAAVSHAADVQKVQDHINTASAVKEAVARQKEDDARALIPEEVIKHVTVRIPCPTYGFIRVLNGYAHGLKHPDTSIAPGKPDDACTSVSWRQVADDVADDYLAANGDADQLDGLEENVSSSIAALNKNSQ